MSTLKLVTRAGLIFFVDAFLLGSALSRVPDLLSRLETTKASLGFALLAASLGALAASPFSGRLVDRASPARLSAIAGIALSVMVALIGQAPTVVLLAGILFLAGFANGLMEVAMNAAADRAERAAGRPLIARCHGFWSLGFMAGAFIAGSAAGAGYSDAVHLGVVAAVGLVASVAAARILPGEAHVATAPGDEPGPIFALPGKAIAGVCLMVVGITVAEGAIYDWGMLHLRAGIGVPPVEAGFAFGCFALAMAIGRFCGDYVRARLAAPVIVRWAALLGVAGLVGFIFATGPVSAGLALAVMGLGVSPVFPIAVSSASAKGGASAAANLAGLSLTVMAALMTGPPLVGLLSEAFGLENALLAMVPAVALTGLVAAQAVSMRPADIAARKV